MAEERARNAAVEAQLQERTNAGASLDLKLRSDETDAKQVRNDLAACNEAKSELDEKVTSLGQALSQERLTCMNTENALRAEIRRIPTIYSVVKIENRTTSSISYEVLSDHQVVGSENIAPSTVTLWTLTSLPAGVRFSTKAGTKYYELETQDVVRREISERDKRSAPRYAFQAKPGSDPDLYSEGGNQ